METKYFICEIIKPIKRRSIKTALNKTKSMNKVLSVHTCVEQCLYQFLRDGQCCNGKDPHACKEFKQQTGDIDLGQISSDLTERLKGSIVLQYQRQAERNRVSIPTDSETEEVFTRSVSFPPMDEQRERVSVAGVTSHVWFDPAVDSVTRTQIVRNVRYTPVLRVISPGGDRVNKEVPKSLCTECGAWVQYPHDPEKLTVTCWLCVAKEVLAYEHKKPETPDIKTKEAKTNGKRTSIPKRKKAGRRNSRA